MAEDEADLTWIENLENFKFTISIPWQDGILDVETFYRHFDKISYIGYCFITFSLFGLVAVFGHFTLLYLIYLVMYFVFCLFMLIMIITHILNTEKLSIDIHQELRRLWLAAANSNIEYVQEYLIYVEETHDCCGFYNVLE